MIQVFIRRPEPHELESVRVLVQTVVDEVYGGLWAPPPLPIDHDCWDGSWIALMNSKITDPKIADAQIVGEKIIGVVLTNAEWLDDLWVLRESRGCGVGRRLVAQAEAEIIARGHDTFRLRVVRSNEAAVGFYRRHGWQIARTFPHEKFPITMLEMFKTVRVG